MKCIMSINYKKIIHLTKSQKTKLRKVADKSGVWINSRTKAGKFIEIYILSEAIARYLIEINTKKKCPQTLYLNSIKSACKNIDFTRSISSAMIENIFKSESTTKIKSHRQLRNRIIHEASDNAIADIDYRYQELMLALNNWIKYFK